MLNEAGALNANPTCPPKMDLVLGVLWSKIPRRGDLEKAPALSGNSVLSAASLQKTFHRLC